MPQKRISIWTSCSVGSRRSIVVDWNGDVALFTEYALALYMKSPLPYGECGCLTGSDEMEPAQEIESGPHCETKDLREECVIPILLISCLFLSIPAPIECKVVSSGF